MTDADFLAADFDTLLQTMTVDQINARHDAIDASRAAQAMADEAGLLTQIEALKLPAEQQHRRCLYCGTPSPRATKRCPKCFRAFSRLAPLLSLETKNA